RAALRQLEQDANRGTMFERPSSELNRYRPAARLIAAGMVGALAFVSFLLLRGRRKRERVAGVYRGSLPWTMLAPALLLIAVWGYYPLARGLVMAFQDYRVVGASPFVGLDD